METGYLVIIWHSRTGASRALAEAVEEGALRANAGPPARRVEAARADAQTLLAAGGFVFIAPENLGALSGVMKDLFDRTYYPLLGRIEGRPYATVIAAGSDGTGAQRQIDTIVTGWRLKRVVEPMIVNLGVQSPEAILAPKTVSASALDACRALGEGFAHGIELGVF